MLKVLGTRILGKRHVPEKVQSSFIIIESDAAVDSYAEVIGVGEEVKSVKVGDIILHGKYSGSPVEVDGAEMMVFEEKDVMAILI